MWVQLQGRGMTPMTAVFQQRDAGCLGRTVWEEERELPFMGAQLEHTELCLEIDEELTKSLWAKIKEKTGTGDIVGVCYRPPDQQEQPS